MKKNLFRFSVLFLAVVFSCMACRDVSAQDKGDPAVQSLAFYTAGGGLGGMALGIAYWMLDPLAPNADLRGSMLQGYGVGVFLGFIFGITQLNKQAVFPYTEPPPIDEFEGNIGYRDLSRQRDVFAELRVPRKNPGIPLFSFRYRF